MFCFVFALPFAAGRRGGKGGREEDRCRRSARVRVISWRSNDAGTRGRSVRGWSPNGGRWRILGVPQYWTSDDMAARATDTAATRSLKSKTTGKQHTHGQLTCVRTALLSMAFVVSYGSCQCAGVSVWQQLSARAAVIWRDRSQWNRRAVVQRLWRSGPRFSNRFSVLRASGGRHDRHEKIIIQTEFRHAVVINIEWRWKQKKNT